MDPPGYYDLFVDLLAELRREVCPLEMGEVFVSCRGQLSLSSHWSSLGVLLELL